MTNQRLYAIKKGAASSAPALGEVIRAFKSISTYSINRELNRSGVLWHRNYYEHIRNEQSMNEIRAYIINNPLKWEMDEDNPESPIIRAFEPK